MRVPVWYKGAVANEAGAAENTMCASPRGWVMANQVMTVLEARVPADRWSAMEEGYARMAGNRPAQLEHGFVVQSVDDPTLWRVVGIWQSRAALEEYQRSVAAPGGVLLFRSVGVEPTMSLFEVKGP